MNMRKNSVLNFHPYSFELQAINQQEVDLCMSVFRKLKLCVGLCIWDSVQQNHPSGVVFDFP